jgi:hypothetical protein
LLANVISNVSTAGGYTNHGNQFTLFLHDPLSAFCVVTGINNLNQQGIDHGLQYISAALDGICRILISTPSVGMLNLFYHLVLYYSLFWHFRS